MLMRPWRADKIWIQISPLPDGPDPRRSIIPPSKPRVIFAADAARQSKSEAERILLDV
jgi:hypothetical protein